MIELAGSAAHVVVDSLAALDLSETDDHHLTRVLRLRIGQVVSATDGRGSWRMAQWTGRGLEANGPLEFQRRPTPSVAVGFGLVKGDRADWIVQKLTEIGVDQIVPLVTERCVVRWEGERAVGQVERLRRIAREAVMQSRRVWLPVVEAVTTLPAVLTRPGAAMADFGGAWLSSLRSLEVSLVVVGPEGGWSATERGLSGRRVCLSDHVLRTETAALVAGSLLIDQRRVRPESTEGFTSSDGV